MKNHLVALVFMVSFGQALGYQQLPDSVYQKQELGSSLFFQFKFAESIPLLEETADIFKKNGIWKNYFECKYYLNLYIFFNSRNAQLAIDSMQYDLELAKEKMGDMSEGMGDMYFGLGWLHDNTINEKGKGAEYYRMSLETFEKSVGIASAKTAKASANYALILVNLNRNSEAEKVLEKANKVYEATYAMDDLAWTRLYNTAFYFYNGMSMHDQALKYAQAMYELIKDQKSSQFYSRACRNLTMVHYNLREYEASMNYALLELEILENGNANVNKESLIGVYNNLGRISEYLDITASLGYTKRAWEEKKKLYGTAHPLTLSSGLNYGNLLTKVGEMDNAIAILKEQLILSKDPENDIRSNSLLAIANYRADNYSQSREYYNETYNEYMSGRMENRMLAFQYLGQAAVVSILSAIELGDKPALTEASQVFEKVDSLSANYWRNLDYYDDQRAFLNVVTNLNVAAGNLYYALFQLDQDPFYADRFLYATEKDKACLTYPTFLMASKMQQLDVPSEILAYKRQLDQQIINLQSDVSQDQALLIRKIQDRDSLTNVIRFNYPSYYNERIVTNYTTVSELQESLNEGSAYLIYQSGTFSLEKINTGVTTLLITKKNVALWKNPAEKMDLNVEIQRLLQDVRDRQETLSNNDTFYRLLGLDKLNELEGISHITIVPSKELYSLPFDFLSDSNGRYLIEDYTIRYLQSASLGLLLQDQNNRVEVASLVAPEIGQATRGKSEEQSTPVLSNTREEVEEIVTLIGGTILEGQPKKDILESFRNSDLIHLATHAEVNLQTPGKSVMYLANHPDSVLFAYELYKQNLKASLVTLSACNTGSGVYQNGEGIQSLGKAFSYAGCPNLIMSHWAVNDEATAELMQYLYENLKDGMPKDEALRQAKLAYLENADPVKAHPYYWAGFVFSGDPAPLTFQSKNTWWWMLPIGLVIIVGVARVRRRNQS